jgi:hypothetical protein
MWVLLTNSSSFEFHKIAAAQFSINFQIEQYLFTNMAVLIDEEACSPNLTPLEHTFVSNPAARISSLAFMFD